MATLPPFRSRALTRQKRPHVIRIAFVFGCSRHCPAKAFLPRLRPPLGQSREDRLRPMAGKGGGDVSAYLKAPVWALLIGARKIGRNGFADKVIELRVSEHRR